jgi:hypothetical protein
VVWWKFDCNGAEFEKNAKGRVRRFIGWKFSEIGDGRYLKWSMAKKKHVGDKNL